MRLEVTRDVVNDLWPLCRSGEASADSRTLVDTYLAQDSNFARTLQESERLTLALPPFRLSAGAERRLLDDARERARLKMLVIGGAIALTGFLLIVALGGLLLLRSGVL
jgi:ferric-dicitrate binding protein FerR (iron transport regulator)